MQKFYFLDIDEDIDVWITLSDIICAFFLLIYASVGFYRTKKYDSVTTQVKIIFAMIFSWGIFYIAQFSYGIWVYRTIDQKEDYPSQIYSKIYFAIDTIPAFSVQGLFILVPFNLLTNTYELMDKKYYDYQLSSRQLNFYKFIRFYQFVRFLIIIQCFAIFLPVNSDSLYKISLGGITMTIFDVCICYVIVTISSNILLSKNIITQQMRQEDRSQLKLQLRMLFAVTFLRILSDTVLFLPLLYKDKDYFNTRAINTFGYLLAGQILIHLLPIFVIIRLHVAPNKTKKNSLLYETII